MIHRGAPLLKTLQPVLFSILLQLPLSSFLLFNTDLLLVPIETAANIVSTDLVELEVGFYIYFLIMFVFLLGELGIGFYIYFLDNVCVSAGRAGGRVLYLLSR